LLEAQRLGAVGGQREDVGAYDVGRHQVGRELDAAEIEPERLAEQPDEECLAEAGRALDQDVAAGQQRDDDVPDQIGLADQLLGDLGLDPAGHRLGLGDRVVDNGRTLAADVDWLVPLVDRAAAAQWVAHGPGIIRALSIIAPVTELIYHLDAYV